jgi:hypothetical protein
MSLRFLQNIKIVKQDLCIYERAATRNIFRLPQTGHFCELIAGHKFIFCRFHENFKFLKIVRENMCRMFPQKSYQKL